jgi:hypothetical protein
MAHYLKFETLVPAEYTNLATSERRVVPRREIIQFCLRISKTYGGLTESNPTGPPPFRGYWQGEKRIEVDELTTIMVLVRSRDQERAIRDFTRWKRQLEQRYNQQLILVMYHPVQILGEL